MTDTLALPPPPPTEAAHAPTTALVRLLVALAVLDSERLQQTTARLGAEGSLLVHALVRQQQVSAGVVARAASQHFGLPLFDLSSIDPGQLPGQLVDAALLGQHRVLPLRQRGRKLLLGVVDPSHEEGIDAVRRAAGCPIDLVVVEDDKLGVLLTTLQQQRALAVSRGTREDADFGVLDCRLQLPTADLAALDSTSSPEEAPVVRFVDALLAAAIRLRASDLHLEPYEACYRIRFRLDGLLREVLQPPLASASRICARLKIMSQLDIAERRLPQDGRLSVRQPGLACVDFRVSTLPTLWGEKLVLRLLDGNNAQLGIDTLGYEPEQLGHLLAALAQPQGLILVTGPTGSGKTVSLYACLNLLNTTERNIATVEDPVEITLGGINQMAVNPKVGLDFATALRAFLRQDPDVIMVGEIRDPETAEIAVKAAHTGHLVLSTLHTNRATAALTRLASLGIPAFLLATSVTLISAQRLVRRLCSDCKRPVTMTEQQLLQRGFAEAELQDLQLFEAAGCAACHAGYRGRLGIHEVVPIGERLARAIMEGGSAVQLADLAVRAGHAGLHRAGLHKAARGLTSLAEVQRVTGGS
jgi:type IV pilus assembly protein PilB